MSIPIYGAWSDPPLFTQERDQKGRSLIYFYGHITSMNVKKMKTMVVCRDKEPDVRIVVNGQVIKEIKKLKYLCQRITDHGRCECEIKNQIEIARSTFIKMREVLTLWKLH